MCKIKVNKMMIKIFWKEKCPNCPAAKALGKKLELEEGMDVTYCNIQEPEGLSESVMYDVLSTPSVIVCDSEGDEIKGWRGVTPSVEEVKKLEN